MSVILTESAVARVTMRMVSDRDGLVAAFRWFVVLVSGVFSLAGVWGLVSRF